MIFVLRQNLPFVVKVAETVAKDIKSVAIVGFEALYEVQPVDVPLSESLIAGDDRQQFGFLGYEHQFELVVIEGAGSDVALGIFGKADKPRQYCGREMHIVMACLLLTCIDGTKLVQISLRIDKHRLRLCGEEYGVLRSYTAVLSTPHSFALHYPEDGIWHLRVITEPEAKLPIQRYKRVSLGLSAIDGAQLGAVGREAYVYHSCVAVVGLLRERFSILKSLSDGRTFSGTAMDT